MADDWYYANHKKVEADFASLNTGKLVTVCVYFVRDAVSAIAVMIVSFVYFFDVCDSLIMYVCVWSRFTFNSPNISSSKTNRKRL